MDYQIEDRLYQEIDQNLNNNITQNITQIDSDINIDLQPVLSREEYIIEAREACLRQLDNINFNKHYCESINPIDEDCLVDNSSFYSKKLKTLNHNNDYKYNNFKFFIIRVIFACILLFSIIVIDKTDIKFGNISSENIQKYVLHIDVLEDLQEVFINFIK